MMSPAQARWAAARDGHKRGGERGRLGADAVRGWIDLGRAGRGGFDRARRSRRQSRVSKSAAMAKKDDLLVKLDTSAEEAQLHICGSRSGTGARQPRTRARSGRAQSRFESGTRRRRIAIQTEERIGRQHALDDRARRSCARRSTASLAFAQVNVGQSINARQQVVAFDRRSIRFMSILRCRSRTRQIVARAGSACDDRCGARPRISRAN